MCPTHLGCGLQSLEAVHVSSTFCCGFEVKRCQCVLLLLILSGLNALALPVLSNLLVHAGYVKQKTVCLLPLYFV